MRRGKEIAKEGGKYLAAIGLSPAAAIEETGRHISGKIHIKEALGKKVFTEEKISSLEDLSPEKRPEYYDALMEILREESKKSSEEIIKCFNKMHTKGKILRLIEELIERLIERPRGER